MSIVAERMMRPRSLSFFVVLVRSFAQSRCLHPREILFGV
jgi:hypothetical protein